MATHADEKPPIAAPERDYFTDMSVLKDPYDYFDDMRARGPVVESTIRDMVVVTGFAETLDVLKNAEDFSSAVAVQGAAQPLPMAVEGPDISEAIEAHRAEFMGGQTLVTYDGTKHSFSRSILNRLFTPSRLKANERFIESYADQLVREMVAKGGCELIKDVATPFVTLVIADLLGVPEDDRDLFAEVIDNAPPPGNMETQGAHDADIVHPLEFMGRFFVQYLSDRRANPREDVMTDLALAKYPDGSTPDIMEIVSLSTFLFGAGQDTSAKLLGNAMRHLVDEPGLQDFLRANPKRVGDFVEEMLRLEGSSKQTVRLAKRDSRIGGVDVPVGKRILIGLAAANRDPARWEDPNAIKLDRPRIREHVAFGRGAHTCAGAPLARVEVRVILEKFLEHTTKIDLLEAEHGPRGARTIEYEPSFIIRGIAKMHLTLE